MTTALQHGSQTPSGTARSADRAGVCCLLRPLVLWPISHKTPERGFRTSPVWHLQNPLECSGHGTPPTSSFSAGQIFRRLLGLPRKMKSRSPLARTPARKHQETSVSSSVCRQLLNYPLPGCSQASIGTRQASVITSRSLIIDNGLHLRTTSRPKNRGLLLPLGVSGAEFGALNIKPESCPADISFPTGTSFFGRHSLLNNSNTKSGAFGLTGPQTTVITASNLHRAHRPVASGISPFTRQKVTKLPVSKSVGGGDAFNESSFSLLRT